MKKTMSLQEAFEKSHDIDGYIERWERIRSEEDPLVEQMRKYVEKAKQEKKEEP